MGRDAGALLHDDRRGIGLLFVQPGQAAAEFIGDFLRALRILHHARGHQHDQLGAVQFLFGLSGSRSKINAFREKYQFKVPVFLNDEIGLKAIARSNPSMMILEKGVVKGKFPHRSIPTYEWLKKNTFKK